MKLFDKVSLEQAIKDTGKEANVKGKVLFMSTRIATTGDMHGPACQYRFHYLEEILS